MLMPILGETQQAADRPWGGDNARTVCSTPVCKLTVSTPLLRITSTGMLFMYCSTGVGMMLAAKGLQHSSGLQ